MIQHTSKYHHSNSLSQFLTLHTTASAADAAAVATVTVGSSSSSSSSSISSICSTSSSLSGAASKPLSSVIIIKNPSPFIAHQNDDMDHQHLRILNTATTTGNRTFDCINDSIGKSFTIAAILGLSKKNVSNLDQHKIINNNNNNNNNSNHNNNCNSDNNKDYTVMNLSINNNIIQNNLIINNNNNNKNYDIDNRLLANGNGNRIAAALTFGQHYNHHPHPQNHQHHHRHQVPQQSHQVQQHSNPLHSNSHHHQSHLNSHAQHHNHSSSTSSAPQNLHQHQITVGQTTTTTASNAAGNLHCRERIKHEHSMHKKNSLKSKRVRTIFTPEQLERLEREFERQQYMVGPERLYLAHTLQLTEAQVKVWFQNRRIKWRKHHLELTQQRLAIIRQRQITNPGILQQQQPVNINTGTSPSSPQLQPRQSQQKFQQQLQLEQHKHQLQQIQPLESDISVCTDSRDATDSHEVDGDDDDT